MAAESIVLEETIDENYEPTPEEIEDYAKYLGMDLQEDKHLFWVAREGLKAPLPSEWKPCQSPDGELYYFNFSTGESVWDHPCDEYYRKLYKVRKRLPRRLQTLCGFCCRVVHWIHIDTYMSIIKRYVFPGLCWIAAVTTAAWTMNYLELIIGDALHRHYYWRRLAPPVFMHK